ncbi:sensor domain-containing protein [Mycobacterium sp. NPDC050041]|uniref:sensor domain-containing protein n=1 Tax=Mycobacterium sp. NPDC050041 TaxID=3364293 RepID=UPI003C30DED2
MRAAAVLTAVTLLAGCASPTRPPVPTSAPPAPPTAARPLGAMLPTQEELAGALGIPPAGFMGQLVEGGADMLLRGVDRTEATPVDCVSPTYRLQQMVYAESPVRSVATRSWAGGSVAGPSMSAYLGVVQFDTADEAQRFFAASAQKWRHCDGQTLLLQQPDRGAREQSMITDVAVGDRVVSAVVLHDAGDSDSLTLQRALGVAGDCVVDVEITDLEDAKAAGADGAVHVADLMLDKIAR